MVGNFRIILKSYDSQITSFQYIVLLRGQNVTQKLCTTKSFRNIYDFLFDIPELMETSGNLRRARFFKSSKDILHHMHTMSRSSKTRMGSKFQVKMFHDKQFSRNLQFFTHIRKHTETNGNFRKAAKNLFLQIFERHTSLQS